MKGQCDCGAVTVEMSGRPDKINACPCDYCRGIGARWGYFPAGEVTVTGETHTHRRAARVVEFHRCTVCGVLIHWADPDGKLKHKGVHMQNFDPAALEGVPVVVEP